MWRRPDNKSAESRDRGFSRAQKMGGGEKKKDRNEPNMNLFH